MTFEVFGREISVSDEDMQWVRDQDAYMNSGWAEDYIKCFLGVEDDKEKIQEVIQKYSDEELSEIAVKAARKYVTERKDQRGTLFVRNDLLADWLMFVYNFDDFVVQERLFSWNMARVRGTVPFAEFAAKPEDIELLLKHYYFSSTESIPFDDWMFLERAPEHPDRCWRSEYLVRSTTHTDEETYQYWKKENEPGAEPLEHILRFDVMRSEFCRTNRLWIGGIKEKVVVYFYGRDSHGYDMILYLKPRNENDDWDPSVLWQKPEEMPRYHFHREEDLFIWESAERRVIFSEPDIRLDDFIYFIAEKDDIYGFAFDMLSENSFVSEGKRMEEKYFNFIGGCNNRIFDLRDFLNRMLYMPARIAGTRTMSGLYQWVESTRSLDAFEHSGKDVYTVIKMEKEDGNARFDIIITEYEGDDNFCGDEEWGSCWNDQGCGDSFGLFGLCRSDVRELLKCLDEFIQYALEKAVLKYCQYVLMVPHRSKEPLVEWDCRLGNRKPEPGEWWEVVFRPHHWGRKRDRDGNYETCHYEDRYFDNHTNVRVDDMEKYVAERMKEAGFEEEQANIFNTKNMSGISFDELKAVLERITDDSWVHENICFIGILIRPFKGRF